MLRRVLLAAAVVAAALAGAACSEDPPPAPSDDAALQEGADVYKQQCSSCHGVSGGGGLGPAMGGVSETLTFDQHVDVVTNGRDGTNMSAFEGRLTPEQIDAVVRYEREVLDG